MYTSMHTCMYSMYLGFCIQYVYTCMYACMYNMYLGFVCSMYTHVCVHVHGNVYA